MKFSVIWQSSAFPLLLCCALPGPARAAETPEQRGKRVVYEALQALGGDAFLHMNGRVESGRAYSFYNKQISGLSIAKIYTRYLEPLPGKVEVRERENFGLKEDSGVLFTENEAWEMNFHGARPMDDDKFASYKISTLRNIFYILRMRRNEPGMIFESRGADVIHFRHGVLRFDRREGRRYDMRHQGFQRQGGVASTTCRTLQFRSRPM